MEGYKAQRLRFEGEQQEFWTALKKKLESFRDNCGASMAEMAEGLGISRQPLYNFMEKPADGLSRMDRLALLSLWAYLTDPKQYQNRKLKQEHRDARKLLYQEGPDNLLRAAGFLGYSDLNKKAITIEDPQMKRLVLRLKSKWLYDDALRAYIINGFLDDLLDQGRPDRNSYLVQLDYEKEDDKRKIEEWPFTSKLYPSEEERYLEITNQYRRAIDNLVASGKTQFIESELFELYQSILEHDEDRDGDHDLKIERCEFETLSSKSILDKLDFSSLQIQAEKRVAINPEIIKSKDQFPQISEVKISCRFTEDNSTDSNSDSSRESYFKYASTATHVENMLMAIKQGLCHPLKISGFFTRAVGRTDKSLARAAIALSEDDLSSKRRTKIEKVYQGWWVSSNTILGILKAFVDAFKRWLSEKKDIQNKEYYDACRRLSDVNERFYEINTAVFEGNFDVFSNSGKRGGREENTVEEKICETIEDIEEVENKDLFKSMEEVRLRLKGKEFRLKLTLLHLNIYQGRMEEAKKIVDAYQDPRELVEKGVNSLDKEFQALLIMSAHVEYMKYKLVAGDKQLLQGKLWKIDPKYSLEKCEKVARAYVKRSGNINFNCYSFMAEFFSALGVMEFYAVENGMEDLKKGCEYLIESAHYSLRIGYERKAAQSLLYVVRCLSRLRLDDVDQKSQNILNEVETVVNRKQSAQDRDWLNAIFHLSCGEKYLLIDNAPDKAMVEFLSAFRCSIDIGYIRLVPDCLYNIFRASKKIQASIDREAIIEQMNNVLGEEKIRQKFPFSYDGPYNQVLESAMGVEEKYTGGKIDESKIEENGIICRDAAIKLWNKWAQVEEYTEHVFSRYIYEGKFLSPLSKDKD